MTNLREIKLCCFDDNGIAIPCSQYLKGVEGGVCDDSCPVYKTRQYQQFNLEKLIQMRRKQKGVER